MDFCIIFKSVCGSTISTMTRKIWGSNLGRSNRTISSPKHPDQLQHPTSLQLNKKHSFFSGSKVAGADNLTTHICLAQCLKISGAIPPLNMSPSMAHSGTTLFHLNLLSLKRLHPFWSYKGTCVYITYPLHAHYMTHLFHLHWSNYINIMKSYNNETHINFWFLLLLAPSISHIFSW